MNPITNIQNQNCMNERELNLGYAGDLKKSWHQQYKDSAWIHIGGLSYALTEGDVIAVFSQYGEVMNVNLIRDKGTGKSKGFAFLCYKDQRSTVLAVDSFNGITLHKRMIRVDHVEEYKVPNYKEDADEETRRLWEEGCASRAIMQEAEPMEIQENRIENTEEYVMDVGGVDKKILKQIKKNKKKQAKKEKKREKKRVKKLEMLKKKAARDSDGDRKNKAKLNDKVVAKDDLYGENKHFDFGKKKEVEEVKHNPRPDFEKADWRDIEIWKVEREREKAEKAAKGESTEAWRPEEHYVSKRYQGR